MKYPFVSTLAVFVLSTGAFASSPLSQVKEITVSTATQFTTWVAHKDKSGVGSASTFEHANGSVDCSLEAFDVKLNRFRKSKSEQVGDGKRYYVSPKEEITLKVKSATAEIRSEKPACNGEPELCDPADYDVRYETLMLEDSASNDWMLFCISFTAANPISGADIGIRGVEAK